MVILEEGREPRSVRFAPADPALCVFELIYFARPDSYMEGRNLYEVAAARWAWSSPASIPPSTDLVMPVPDTGAPAAAGYAEASGIPYREGLVRNRYTGRTFIQPSQTMRQRGRDDQAQPAPRGRPRPAAHRGRRFDRAGDHDEADRRAPPAGGSGRGPRPDQRSADLPPVLLRHRHPDRDRAHRRDQARSTRSAISSAPIRSATCRSPASSPRSTCRTSGSASPASTAAIPSRSPTTPRAASSSSRRPSRS